MRDTARVRVNGREAGIAWIKPYRVEITDLLKSGENTLELEVANNWPNRLIGDMKAKKAGLKPVTWTNFADAWKAEDEFIPAGLIGPVRILTTNASKIPTCRCELSLDKTIQIYPLCLKPLRPEAVAHAADGLDVLGP